MEDRALVKKGKLNIFEKIYSFFKNILNKKDYEVDKQKNNIKEKENIINEIKKENEIIRLQKNYENGKIKEDDLTENEKEQIFLLYKKQIEELENKISNYNKIMKNYKIKIIEEKNKITN